ncbi:MAG: rhodanese-like domain-containing protein [Bacilli bacterium]|nr:rhodanese-like domain-containing protein [Bacilli bacterium]
MKKIEDDVVIVDVREKEEYLEGHIVDSINIPYDTIDKNVHLDKNKKIKVYCKSGKRSHIAYQILKELGYDVEDLGAYDNINMNKTKK